MGETEADSQLLDPELDPKARAAAVDGTGAMARDDGGRNEAGGDRDDEVLAELEEKHGGGRGRRGGKGGDDSGKGRRSSGAPRAASRTRPSPVSSNKPITWTAQDRAAGEVLGRGKEKGEEGEEKPRATRHEPEKRRGAKGRFLAGESGAEREFPDEDEGELEGDEGEEDNDGKQRGARGRRDEQPLDQEDREELRLARKALKRDGWQDEDLDELSDRAILRIGQHRARNQRDIDRRFAADNKDRQRGFTSTQTRPDSRTPDTREEPEADNLDGDDLTELEETLSDALASEDLGKRATKALAKTVQKLIEKRGGRGDTAESDTLVNQLMDERAKARLVERFPQVKQPKLWDKLSRKAETFYREGVTNGDYEPGLAGIDEAFEDAAGVLLGDPERNAERRDQRRTTRNARENGHPSPPGTTRQSPYARFTTREQLDDAWLQARERGDREALQEIEALYENPRLKAFS